MLPFQSMKRAWLAAAIPIAAPTIGAAELRIYFTAVQKILPQQIFTQDGRRYVRGTEKSKCGFVYIDNPRISENKGRLNLRTRVTARFGWEFFGACLDPGDSFDLAIEGSPSQSISNIRCSTI